MSTREYKLAADPIQWKRGVMREILEFTDGQRKVILAVPHDDAMDVLEAIRRAYQDGWEDRSGELLP